ALRASALGPDGNHAGTRLEPELVELQRPAQDERRAQHRVPCERQLERRREDANQRVSVADSRVDKDGLREVDLTRERLQLFLGDPPTAAENPAPLAPA